MVSGRSRGRRINDFRRLRKKISEKEKEMFSKEDESRRNRGYAINKEEKRR